METDIVSKENQKEAITTVKMYDHEYAPNSEQTTIHMHWNHGGWRTWPKC